MDSSLYFFQGCHAYDFIRSLQIFEPYWAYKFFPVPTNISMVLTTYSVTPCPRSCKQASHCLVSFTCSHVNIASYIKPQTGSGHWLSLFCSSLSPTKRPPCLNGYLQKTLGWYVIHKGTTVVANYSLHLSFSCCPDSQVSVVTCQAMASRSIAAKTTSLPPVLENSTMGCMPCVPLALQEGPKLCMCHSQLS